MHKRFLILGCLCAAVFGLSLPQHAAAGPVPVDGVITMGAAQTCATNPIALTAGSFDIDRIVFYNSGAVTSAVVVAAYDVGVSTALGSFALAAPGGSVQWPRRTEVYGTTTNAYMYTARDLLVVSYKPTNATDVVIYYRIFGR